MIRLLCFPGHALHEKGSQSQKGRQHTGPQPGTKSGRRPTAVVPRINRLSTGCQPRVNRTFCSPCGLHRVSVARASEKSPRTVVQVASEGKRGGILLGEPIRRRPVLLRTAPPLRRAPPRPDPSVVCPGFGFDRSLWRTLSFLELVSPKASKNSAALQPFICNHLNLEAAKGLGRNPSLFSSCPALLFLQKPLKLKGSFAQENKSSRLY